MVLDRYTGSVSCRLDLGREGYDYKVVFTVFTDLPCISLPTISLILPMGPALVLKHPKPPVSTWAKHLRKHEL